MIHDPRILRKKLDAFMNKKKEKCVSCGSKIRDYEGRILHKEKCKAMKQFEKKNIIIS